MPPSPRYPYVIFDADGTLFDFDSAMLHAMRETCGDHGLAFTDLATRAEDIKRHHHERLEKLRAASGELGRGTVHEYMQVLFAERSWGPMAESETYAHLEHLRLHGEADVDDSGAQLRYSFD